MQKSNQVETLNSRNSELINEVANTSSVELFNGVPQDTPDTSCDCSLDEALPEENKSNKVRAIINGQEQDIIVAFTPLNVEVPKKKEELLGLVNKANLLPVKYNLAHPDIFGKEGYTLLDKNGDEISPDTPNLYVLCPEPSTNIRIFIDDFLSDVEIHKFGSVQEWATKVGSTNLLTQGFNKVKEVGIAAAATGNAAAKAVAEFAQENGIPESVAEAHLGARFTPKTTTLMMLGHKPKIEIKLERTPEEAQKLFNQIKATFGSAECKKRYAIRAISSILDEDEYDLETVLEALKSIPAERVTYAKLKKCGDKENCIVKVLCEWIIKMQRAKIESAA